MGFARRIIRALEVPQTNNPESAESQQFISNDDLLPVPPEERTWDSFAYVAFWVSTAININTWMITSSMIQLGMSWWQAWICVWLGYGVVTPFVVLNARPGAIFHVTFPVVNRTSFGIFGSLWCVFNRAAMACIWYGVQASIGGNCVLVMLQAMWPSVMNIPNSMPLSAGIDTKDYMAFFLFWVISLPFIWFPVHTIRHFFTFKTIITPIACLVFMVWCIIKAKGVGPIVNQPGTLHGAPLGWAMVSGAMSCISNLVTLVTNAPDFGSRAKYPSATVYAQLWSIPLSYGVLCLVGVLVSSSSQAIYGEAIWSPVTLLQMFLNDNPSHAARFGVWFIAASFIIAQIGTNISANSVSAGCDLTALFPRFINIRRGGYISAIVGLCMCPWNLLKSSSSFTSYLSAYSVFLSSIAGVMATEYWIVRKGHYNIADLYTTRKGSWYWYTYGFNLRAYAAYVAGIIINVVGFAGDTGRPVPVAAIHIYDLSFFTGFGTSAIVYWALNRVFPVQGASAKFEEIDVSGYFDDMTTSQSEETDTKDGLSDTEKV
ncbi:NCS1 nucleoside transporter family [Leucogyrophana mollusca]|uniref:NCS1 nucleoside transporter family n=1 Tax=Leucogyrophana mollusca TaxID=85980 RepID=A0ACB8BJU0_9AGAM|nr:NCS1 nucleoside transporter family [Leucogyrophana mollusca]